MGELAGSNLIELSFDLLDRTDQRPGDSIAEAESEQMLPTAKAITIHCEFS